MLSPTRGPPSAPARLGMASQHVRVGQLKIETHHLATSKDEGRRLRLADAHDHSREALPGFAGRALFSLWSIGFRGKESARERAAAPLDCIRRCARATRRSSDRALGRGCKWRQCSCRHSSLVSHTSCGARAGVLCQGMRAHWRTGCGMPLLDASATWLRATAPPPALLLLPSAIFTPRNHSHCPLEDFPIYTGYTTTFFTLANSLSTNS